MHGVYIFPDSAYGKVKPVAIMSYHSKIEIIYYNFLFFWYFYKLSKMKYNINRKQKETQSTMPICSLQFVLNI